ncbi:hypothetical protein [Gordonia westfalica]|uniref:Uncharacterized protein n=1 Tax=Gordonia westfalica TaxID=158898 RepID=A0A1H2DLK9_9ACTN|nr:hypothetical protein [Gordonia westfalica]SDT83785.1 hypothetical protein SAMN04488548_10323 [Gordonia westfalica]
MPADLLVGDTEEEMRAHLDRLQSFRGPKQTVPPAAPASVVANADAAPANKVQQLTQADLKNMSPAQIRDADAKGQLDELKASESKEPSWPSPFHSRTVAANITQAWDAEKVFAALLDRQYEGVATKATPSHPVSSHPRSRTTRPTTAHVG